MDNFQETFQMLSTALGWALLHSLWQGLLLFGPLWLILKLVPQASARLRYRLALLALAGMAGWFVYTLAGYWQNMQPYTVTISTSGNIITWQQPVKYDPLVLGAQVTRWLAPFEAYLPLAVFLYMAGVAVLMGRLVYNIAGIRRLTMQRVSAPTGEWPDLLQQCMQQLNITRKVRLLFSEKITVPMITGTLKPIVLVPLATVTRLDAYQAEAILLHELAHIKRYDYLLNIVQTIVETILFFNPFVWAVSAIIRCEREHCCDDMVIAHTRQPISYAHALAALETFRQNPLAMAATGNNNQLLHRIKRMMEMNRNPISYGPLFTVALAALLTVSFVWLTPAVAQSKKDKAATEATPDGDSTKVVRKERITIVDPNGNKRTYNSIADVPEEDKKKLEAGGSKKNVVIKKTLSGRDGGTGEDEELPVDIEKTIQEALAGVDWNQINAEVSSAMAEANTALAEIDWEKIGSETRRAMEESKKGIDEAKKALAEIDWTKVNAETQKALAESQKALAVSQEEMNKALAETRKALRESEREVRRAHATPPAPPVHPVPPVPGRSSYDRMLARMDAEGLIDRDRKYKVEKKNGALYIDGKKQPDATYRKYSRYLDSGETVTIKGNKGSLTVTVENNK